MLTRLFENIFLAFIITCIVFAIVEYNIYDMYSGSGFAFDETLTEFIEHVLYVNAAIFGLSLVVLLTSVKTLWENQPLRLFLNYFAPLVMLVHYTYISIKNRFTVEYALPNFIVIALYLLIYSIFIRRRNKKFIKT